MIVLDTHVFYWYARANPRLETSIAKIINSYQGEILISAVSIWELLMLDEKGRIEIDAADKPGKLLSYLDQANIKVAPVTAQIAVLSRTLQFAHNDPADRFIAATAYALGATLATQDQHMRQLPWISLTV